MKLPPHILSQVSWFEHSTERDHYQGGFNNVFVLHFKQWWKPRKTIRIAAQYGRTENDRVIYDYTQGARDLLAQLNAHCSA